MNSASIQIENEVNGKDAAALIDVVIVGGGFAGCLAAIALGSAGHKVTLIDINLTSPATLFRAEKIAGDQITMLKTLGLFEGFRAASTPVAKFINIRGKRIIDRAKAEEYGLLYPAMIDLMRKRIPSGVFKHDRVVDIEPSDDIQRVILASGETISTRLVVLATGHGEFLRRKLGFERRQMHPQKTVCVGFSIKPPASGFRFPGLAAYGERRGDGVDYLALFPLGDGMRGNLFMFADIHDPRVGALRDRGLPALFEFLPGVRPWIGDCEWIGKTSVNLVELYKCDHVVRNGVVLIGDAFRTSCPAVGTGLSCALVDVVQLREHVANWMKTPGMDAAKVASFYSDPVKVARDASTHKLALKRRYTHRASLVPYLWLTAQFTRRVLCDRLRAESVP